MKNPMRLRLFLASCTALFLALPALSQQKADERPWRFAVSGDSRNCGDVIMPAIAASVLKDNVDLYWHLGDFRLMSGEDEDMKERYGSLSLADYRRDSWGDFIAHQIAPFGLLPVYLGIGNHELPGRTQAEYVSQFAYWLDRPEIRKERAADNPPGDSMTYFHWRAKNVDFISMDNAPEEGFSEAQLLWLEGVLARDKDDSGLMAVVVGMHRALPNSLACGHSMNGDLNTPAETAAKSLASGRRAYEDLLRFQQQTSKRVYVLASHSHFLMDRIFETPYWKNRGVLPGWIAGTAGAVRYALPESLPEGVQAETGVSGYLLGTVAPNGEIKIEFHKVTQDDLPKPVHGEFTEKFIQACFLENKSPAPHQPPPSCSEK